MQRQQQRQPHHHLHGRYNDGRHRFCERSTSHGYLTAYQTSLMSQWRNPLAAITLTHLFIYLGRVPMQSAYYKRLLCPLTALTRHKQRLRKSLALKTLVSAADWASSAGFWAHTNIVTYLLTYLHRWVEHKSDAESKALTPSPFVYFISSHINSQ